MVIEDLILNPINFVDSFNKISMVETTAPVPTPAEGETLPPTDIPFRPPARASDSSVSDIDIRGAIQMLTHIVASQAQRLSVGPTPSSHPGESASSRVNKFLQLDPPMFTGTDPEEDPQDFIDEMHKTLRVMHATDAFMDHFLPAETKAARAVAFESLKQGSMNVWEYHMEFARLSKYAIHMLHTMEARVRRFVQGLSPLVINEASTAALNSDMNYGKMVAFSQATETRKLKNRMEDQSSSKTRSAGNLGGSSGGGGGRSAFRGGSSGPSLSFAQSSMGAQLSGHNQGNMGPYQQGRPDRRFQQRRLPCPKCGRMHFGSCFVDLPVCYGCGLRGHIQIDCCSSRQNIGRGAAHPINSAATTSTAPPARGIPAPTGRGAARGGAQNLGGPRRFYAMRRRRESEASPDVFTVKEKQYSDPLLVQLKDGIHKDKTMSFSLGMDDGTLRYQGRLCVPNVDGLRERILTEAHTSRYSVHPGSSKMYHDLKEVYWWNDMKRNVADFVARCPNC
ncbi:uncharacterized protein [Nicotiana tomentosiformis]|uniref:uncharacterized protein n=1 Tax=Nicotiana tomentosiformis TaxID=4098 RepID=UPI00388CB14A